MKEEKSRKGKRWDGDCRGRRDKRDSRDKRLIPLPYRVILFTESMPRGGIIGEIGKIGEIRRGQSSCVVWCMRLFQRGEGEGD